MLDAVLANTPYQLAEDVVDARAPFIVSGCLAATAQRRVVELHRLPRVARELQAPTGRELLPNLTAGSTVGVFAGEHGQRYNFRLVADLPTVPSTPQGQATMVGRGEPVVHLVELADGPASAPR